MIVTPNLQARMQHIRLLAMDVDGVLTDGTLGYSQTDEIKNFHVADGLGMTTLRLMGYTLAWLSGRESGAVSRRAANLQIPHLFSGVGDKGAVLLNLMRQNGFLPEQAAYIGDDWNDLPAFEVVGVRIAVPNAVPEIRSRADFVTELRGGHGAVREVCNALLDASGQREAALAAYLATLRTGKEAVVGQ